MNKSSLFTARNDAMWQSRQWLNDFVAHVVHTRGASSVRDLTAQEIVQAGWVAVRANKYDAQEFLNDLDLEGLLTEIKEDRTMTLEDAVNYIEGTFLDSKTLCLELDELLEDEYHRQYASDLDDIETDWYLDLRDRVKDVRSVFA